MLPLLEQKMVHASFDLAAVAKRFVIFDTYVPREPKI
jgi:hypothetical protein